MPASERSLKWFVYYFKDNPDGFVWTDNRKIKFELEDTGLIYKKQHKAHKAWVYYATKEGRAYLALAPRIDAIDNNWWE
jgi:hypothetical protein